MTALGRDPFTGRRRGNSSPEPLRHQDRAGETPLESGFPAPAPGNLADPVEQGRIGQDRPKQTAAAYAEWALSGAQLIEQIPRGAPDWA